MDISPNNMYTKVYILYSASSEADTVPKAQTSVYECIHKPICGHVKPFPLPYAIYVTDA